jgi:uncharacterized protein (TIGR00369 family)
LRADGEFANLEYGPERLFGITSLEWDADDVRGVMSNARGVGEIGVLIDDVMGNAILARRPGGYWSVSTEIALDVVRATPWTGSSEVHAHGWLANSTQTDGLALGTASTASGQVIAHCRQRGRFVPLAGDIDAPPQTPVVRHGELEQAYGLVDIDANVVETTVDAGLCNPLGNLHGGVALAISELLASRPDRTHQRRATTSIHVAYLRPIPRHAVIRFHVDRIHEGRSLAVSHVISRTLSGKACTVATVVQT